ncbi:MAG: cyanophycin synthetase, partial [Flavisolibacter sp.]|nr:cyanophycin synthetase [Flavisolibacter sp.]
TPITENGGAIIEVNAAPGLRMHLEPSKGERRNVAAPIIDMLFPDNDNGRIPIVAITGTNGKTTTTRLIAHMAQQAGYTTGYTTTEGIYINKELIYKGDCSGPGSARVVLKDNSVEFAVLETARGGIIRSGLGYDVCDCAVITNVAEDHLGLSGIDTLEQLAKVKAVVAKSVMPDGYVVLNADDDLVYRMKDEVTCKVALFSIYPESVRIQQHCESGGIAAVCDEGYIMLREGNRIVPIEHVENVPLTFGGKAEFNIYNVLGATMAAYLSKISLPAIRCTLRRFSNSQEMTPGRMNHFYFPHFTLMVDYAHNPHGVKALGNYIKNIAASKKVGIIAGVGDRRDEDIIAVGEESAKIFDEIIIRSDDDLRGRTEAEITDLLRKGIQNVHPNKSIFYFKDEIEAIGYAVESAVPDSFIVLMVEKIDRVCEKVRELQAQERFSTNKMQIAV